MLAEVIIPTRRRVDQLIDLVGQIRDTAGCRVDIIYTGVDTSASINRNIGLSQLRGEVAVMVDDDIEFPARYAGWLKVMLAALDRPEVVMVSAQMFDAGGAYAYMTGLDDCGNKPKSDGETVVPSKRLLTACCAFKHCGLRFDEGYIGSGFEDVDFCNQLALKRPDGMFLVCHGARAVHRNECKNQRGEYWRRNEAFYIRKWGKS